MGFSARIVSTAGVLSAFLLFTPLSSRAQMRTAPMVAAHQALRTIHVRPGATHLMAVPRARINTAAPRANPPTHARILVPPADNFGNQFLGGSGQTLQELLDPVPGPGFNYAHVAALNRDLGIKAVIDPETQWRLAVAQRVLRSTGGFATPGFYLLDGGGAYILPAESSAQQPEQQQQPEVIVLQQPAQKSAESESAPAATAPAAPVPDVGNFTLVLRNGQHIQAVAVTRSGDRIVYITADGARHTIEAGELDNAATERVNQESGTQLTL